MATHTHSGYISKEGGSGFIKNWKKRWAVLNPVAGTLSYFEDKNLGKPLNVIFVKEAHITTVGKSLKGKDFCFAIIQPEKTFYAHVDNQNELNGWLNALRLAAQKTTTEIKPAVIDEIKSEDLFLNLYASFLLKLSADKKWMKKWVILNSSDLECFKTKIAKDVEESIPLKGCSIQFPPKSKYTEPPYGCKVRNPMPVIKDIPTSTSGMKEFGEENLFFIESSLQHKTHLLIARTSEELDVWVKQILASIENMAIVEESRRRLLDQNIHLKYANLPPLPPPSPDPPPAPSNPPPAPKLLPPMPPRGDSTKSIRKPPAPPPPTPDLHPKTFSKPTPIPPGLKKGKEKEKGDDDPDNDW